MRNAARAELDRRGGVVPKYPAMDPQSFLRPMLALAFTVGVGCIPESSPPSEAAAAATHDAHPSGVDPDAGQYYALPGIDHGLLQSPVNILSDETEYGRHTIEYRGGR